MKLPSTRFIDNELLVKIALVLVLFVCTFLVFKLFQKPVIYNHTLKLITKTYKRDKVLNNYVWNVDDPFHNLETKNCRWDAAIYNEIRETYYNKGDHKYSFFPLYPLLWKISGISIRNIGLFNYLLFGLSVILFSMLFFKNENTSYMERLCVFVVSLTLPPVVVYYLPYAEALFTFTFALAMYALMKNKYWLFFIAITLFSMTRPTFVIVGLSFLIIDVFYFLNHRNINHFIKELFLKLAPLLTGTAIVFTMFYLNSGSFTKYFYSINKFWRTSFSIPTKISDWSVDSFGMNVFTIFIVIIAFVLFIKHFKEKARPDKNMDMPSIFNENASFIKEYFFYSSIVYFGGVLLYVLFFQAGSLNGLYRYVVASPFFFMFFFYAYEKLKILKTSQFVLMVIGIVIFGLIILTNQPKLTPAINFNDSGFFIFLLTLIYLFSLRFMSTLSKVIVSLLLVLYSIIWITFLYNAYLCDGWIYT